MTTVRTLAFDPSDSIDDSAAFQDEIALRES
jgi:hypothetical protein